MSIDAPSRTARRPSASAQAAVRPQPGACRARPSRWRRATRSRSFRPWPAAEHGLSHRRSDRARRAARAVQSLDRGGVATSWARCATITEGRAVTRLEYSAYGPMAEAECARIVGRGGAPLARGGRARAPHRALAIGDRPWRWSRHRPTARTPSPPAGFVIEEVKRRVPIWKREHVRRRHGRLGGSHRRAQHA